MRINRIYQNQPMQTGQHIQLDAEASNHLANVLRMREGEQVVLFNGDGSQYLATLSGISKKSTSVFIESHQAISHESPLSIHLAQAVAKGDKMDWIIQKAVELGVKAITPLLTQRCNVKLDAERFDKKVEHWQKVAISACEQCGRNIIPTIYNPISLSKFIEANQAGLKLILHPENSQNLDNLPDFINDLTLLVGPEGGFSEQEIDLAQSQNYITLNLGPRILRTETAPLACMAMLQAKWGDL
ncbi:MAG: rRNA ((1498)-N(3))-methyltransferase [Gammaproteobacteria bacterium]|jgi:16S rRNA (uracil1498-N3)-methyltransferase|nr:rRNA ((1498)-N(3))-methyltransferase [Gammaproteobacteria bacterium]